jgi:predicted nucleic acid-binding protein
MNGNEFLLDTNILVYAMKGLETVKPYFEIEPYISVVTEIEILGLKDITPKEISIRQTAIDYCRIIPLTNRVIKKAIDIKREIKVHVPDAIIAA